MTANEVTKCGMCTKKGVACGVEVAVEPLFSCQHSSDRYEICTICPHISLTICTNCQQYLSVHYEEQWRDIDNLLQDEDLTRNGLQTVRTYIDRVRLYVLSQACHNQHDLDESQDESPYLPHGADESAKLAWKDGQAMGFITVKCKGRLLGDNQWERFAMPVIDTVYIRKAWRGRGLGRQMVEETLKNLACGDVGLSYPVSKGLLQVLGKLLRDARELRDLVWLCTYTGEEGYRENVWLCLRAMNTHG